MGRRKEKKTLSNVSALRNSEIAENIFELTFCAPAIAADATPGQFVNVYANSASRMLPRPISICDVDPDSATVTLIYAVVGGGTREFSQLRAGDTLDVLGPLGNGFQIHAESRENILVAGGVGTPPMLYLLKHLPGTSTIYLGFRSDPYLLERLRQYADVHVATDDGSYGRQGTVIDLLNAQRTQGHYLYACGPRPMLQAVQQWSRERNLPAQLSLEERMGCGFGACVGCVVKIAAENEQGWIYKKICSDGPVFDAGEVIFS